MSQDSEEGHAEIFQARMGNGQNAPPDRLREWSVTKDGLEVLGVSAFVTAGPGILETLCKNGPRDHLGAH